MLLAQDIARIEASGSAETGDELLHLSGKALATLGIVAANTSATVSPAADFGPIAVVASTDGSPTYSKAGNTISAISAQPATAASQISISINGGGAVTLPAGTGYNIDSGSPAAKFASAIVITVLAGTFVFSSRS